MDLSRIPKHVGLIPDGNRRWAEARGLPKRDGYAAGIEPGLRLLSICRALGIEEVSVYGFTKENVRRPQDQVEAFRRSCVEFGLAVVRAGAAFLVVGDTSSPLFPDALQPFAIERTSGDLRINLLVNYGWRWDLATAMGRSGRKDPSKSGSASRALASAAIPPIDLVIRWGGRSRLSGFLPMQCAYADIYVTDTLWPDTQPEEFLRALQWFQGQDVTKGG